MERNFKGGASDHRDRADLMLLDRASGAGYPAGFPSGSRVSYRGDDVLYPRRGDGYDAYR